MLLQCTKEVTEKRKNLEQKITRILKSNLVVDTSDLIIKPSN